MRLAETARILQRCVVCAAIGNDLAQQPSHAWHPSVRIHSHPPALHPDHFGVVCVLVVLCDTSLPSPPLAGAGMFTVPVKSRSLPGAPVPARAASLTPDSTLSPIGGRRSLQVAWRNGADSAGKHAPAEESKSHESSPERRGPFVAAARPVSAPVQPRPTTATPSYILPPHLAHLHFPSQSFPPFLLSIASRVYHAKMRDLGLKEAAGGLDKERRFVWLVCRQSMGASGTSTTSSTSLAAPVSSPLSGGSSASSGGGSSGLDSGMLSFRVPDASLGPAALREICSFLARDTRFAHLQLSGNVLGDDGAMRLASLLARNAHLTSLDIRGTGLGQAAFGVLLASLTTHPSLTSLDASSLKSEGRMYMGVQGCKALAKVLKHNAVLRRLSLANAGLVAEGVSAVVRGLQLNRTLVSLDLACNDLTQKSVAKLGEGLAFLHTLQSLALAENRLGTVGAVVLCETLRKMENLKRVDLRRNGIGLRGFTVLTDAVGEMISLQELLLDGNPLSEAGRGGALGNGGGIGSGGVSAVAVASSDDFRNKDYVDSVVKRLHLTDKRVSPRLLHNSALRTLSLNQTAISDRLVEDLCRVLATHRGLQSLHLGGNALTDVGGFALSELIRHSGSLASLHASENSIGDEGGAAICLALASPASHVTFLALRVNDVGPKTAAAIIHALGHKKALHVDMSGNKVPWVLYSKVAELSSKNKRVFEASLSDRYQAEWERLQQRHEYRLQVEDQCLESIDAVAELEAQLSALEAEQASFTEAENDETKRLEAELADWNHRLHEAHAIEARAEADLSALVKEMDGRVLALRKSIEKEQRFIASAEKLIPQTIEETAAAVEEMEAGLVDVRRDLRLYTTDRNVELDSLVVLKADLVRLLREMEAQVKPTKSPKKGGNGPRSPSPSRPLSRSATSAGVGSTNTRPPTRSASRASAKSPPSSAKKATRPPSAVRSPSVNNRSVNGGAETPSTGGAKKRAATAPNKASPGGGKKLATKKTAIDTMGGAALQAPQSTPDAIASALMGQ